MKRTLPLLVLFLAGCNSVTWDEGIRVIDWDSIKSVLIVADSAVEVYAVGLTDEDKLAKIAAGRELGRELIAAIDEGSATNDMVNSLVAFAETLATEPKTRRYVASVKLAFRIAGIYLKSK